MKNVLTLKAKPAQRKDIHRLAFKACQSRIVKDRGVNFDDTYLQRLFRESKLIPEQDGRLEYFEDWGNGANRKSQIISRKNGVYLHEGFSDDSVVLKEVDPLMYDLCAKTVRTIDTIYQTQNRYITEHDNRLFTNTERLYQTIFSILDKNHDKLKELLKDVNHEERRAALAIGVCSCFSVVMSVDQMFSGQFDYNSVGLDEYNCNSIDNNIFFVEIV